MAKNETIEEYLARGGKITKCPSANACFDDTNSSDGDGEVVDDISDTSAVSTMEDLDLPIELKNVVVKASTVFWEDKVL